MSQVITTQDGQEATVDWTCPSCGHFQTDTVHPELGPFLSATCGACGNLFDYSRLSESDQQAWEEAHCLAETLQPTV